MERKTTFALALGGIAALIAICALVIAIGVSGYEDGDDDDDGIGVEAAALLQRVERLERALASAGAPPLPNKVTEPGGFTKWMVNNAIARYERDGREATLAYYNDPDNMDGAWYVFILEDRDGVLYTMANPSRPELVGTTRERIDANGFNYGEAVMATTEAGGGKWINHLFTHPITREDEPKHTWVERRDNLVFGSGWYRDVP